MVEKFKLPTGVDEEGNLVYHADSPERMLQSFRAVTSSLMRDAHGVWVEMWNALQDCVTTDGIVLPGAEKGSQPKGGWPEFVEKLWLLKHYLDFARKMCDMNRAG